MYRVIIFITVATFMFVIISCKDNIASKGQNNIHPDNDDNHLIISKAISSGDFVTAAKLMEDTEDKYRMYGQFYTFMGRNLNEINGDLGKERKKCLANVTQNSLNAMNTIVSAARNHNVVIINEAHDNSQNRAFIYQLAKALKPLGFNYYAAETFDIGDHRHKDWQSSLIKRGHPVLTDGYYLFDPVFSESVRGILSIGYIPIAYESKESPLATASRNERIKLREKTQAINLYDRVLKIDPSAKILVHVGYSHVKEFPDKNGLMWMAGYLKKYSNIDPLTISQTNCVDTGNTKISQIQSTVQNSLISQVDIDVYPVQEIILNGRSNWLETIGRKSVEIPKALNLNNKWSYLEARPITNRSVVHDRVLKRPSEDIHLSLEPGTYIITAYGAKKKKQSVVKITVK